jgi:hypothetical protein
MKMLVEFMPPDALPRLEAWREAHAAAMVDVPDDAVRIDIGRALGGSFARVWVSEEFEPVFRKLDDS